MSCECSHNAASMHRTGWARPGKLCVSILLMWHLGALVTSVLAPRPSSPIERRMAGFFKSYCDVINQGCGYRMYGKLDMTVNPHHPRPWGTPVVTLDLEFPASGETNRPEQVRLPDRGMAARAEIPASAGPRVSSGE